MAKGRKKDKQFDNPRIIEKILNSGDKSSINAMGKLLERHGFTVEPILNSIHKDRKSQDILSWT